MKEVPASSNESFGMGIDYSSHKHLKWSLIIMICVVLLCIWIFSPSGEIYVSDIEDLNVIKFEWKEPQLDQSTDGNSLLIQDKWYAKGLGVHAETEISVNVPSGYTHFISDVGIDDEITDDKPGSVQFLVIGDGTVLYESPILTPKMAPRRILVDVRDIKILNLKATIGGDTSNSDHADWGGARFVRR